ncbi:hypothetical protein PV762_08630 [Mitsuaria sp. CC2]|uniref:hypothetical protein n=1 Tax=Mitsuaria sp. CC2 TaxID=3029186 RepID=UPI003B8D588E
MSLPLISHHEALVVDRLHGFVSTQDMAKYAPAENEAVHLFQRADPNTLREALACFQACEGYVRRHAPLGECPRFESSLTRRFQQLELMLRTCEDVRQAQDIADEARSMVASLVFRFGPTAGEISLKYPEAPPRNLPDLMECFAGLPERLHHATHLLHQARAVDPTQPEARSLVMALYQQALDEDSMYTSAAKMHRYGPSIDALIDAARTGRSFDDVRQSMLPFQGSRLHGTSV